MSAHRLLMDLYLDGTPHAVNDPGSAGTLNVNRQFAVIKIVTAAAEARTLQDPKFGGQRMLIIAKTLVGVCTITADSAVDGNARTTIILNNVGDYADLVGIEDAAGTFAWRIVESNTVPGVGAKNGSTVTVAEYGNDLLHKTVLTLAATPYTIVDDVGVAQYTGVKIYDFPEGLILTLGGVIDGDFTAGITGTVIDNFDGDTAVGTVTATTGATLTSTESDIIPSTTMSAGASDKIGVVAAPDAGSLLPTIVTESGAGWFDGTATAKDAYLNFVIDDDATHDNGSTATFTGTVTLLWANLGDHVA